MALWAALAAVAGALALAFAALYVYFTRHFGHWRHAGVHELRPLPFVGNMKAVALRQQSVGLFAKQVYEEHKRRAVVGLYAFDEPILQLNDLELVRAVLVKDFASFYDRSFHVSERRDPLLAKGLFVLKGERWKRERSRFGPSFTSGKMKRMFGLVAQSGRHLVDCIAREAPDGAPTEIYEIAARYTTDVIASCAFGLEGNTLRDPRAEFRLVLRKIFEFSPLEGLKWAACFLTPHLMDTFRIKLLKPEVDDYVLRVISEAVRQRQRDGVRRRDFLDSLIEAQRRGDAGGAAHDDDDADDDAPRGAANAPLSQHDEEEVAAATFMILAAGFETSATSMSYALFELARHPALQARLRQELRDAGEATYEVLMNLKYLDMVLQEAMRKYPPLPFLDRVASREYTLPGTGVKLAKGSRVLIPVFGIHMDPDIYPQPERFDPERFAEDEKRARHPMAHMPFGEGPRICAGMRFALMQAKSGLAYILKNFSVHLCNETPEKMSYNPSAFLLQPMPFKLSFRKL